MKLRFRHMLMLFMVTGGLFWPGYSQAGVDLSGTGKKVLVVHSYHKDSGNVVKIQEGLESTVKGVLWKTFFLNTKKNPEDGAVKAKEAYDLYLQFKPDVVVTVDDNAQALFVLPYLKDKVETPVVFCGVNDSADKYGYPTAQITGVLEKKHYREGINFALLIEPSLKKLAVLYKDTPSNKANIDQLKREMESYSVKITSYVAIGSTAELLTNLKDLEGKVDGLIVLNLAGISTEEGKKIETEEAIAIVADQWPKMTIGTSEREIAAGLLCGVIKRNIEQGYLAGDMLNMIFAGKKVADIKMKDNCNGWRFININTARKVGVELKPMVLIGTILSQ